MALGVAASAACGTLATDETSGAALGGAVAVDEAIVTGAAVMSVARPR
jgi:hypothetical protein